jgi:hypothetical protein
MYDMPILAIIRENLDSGRRLPREFILPKDPDDESNLLFAARSLPYSSCIYL